MMQEWLLNIVSYWKEAMFGFLCCWILVKIALSLFPKIGLMDRPWKYGLERAAIPYYGGIVLYLTFVLGLIFFVGFSTKISALLIGLSLIFGISFLDDLFDVSPWIRLLVQFTSALIVVLAGAEIFSLTNPFGEPFSLSRWIIDIDLWGYKDQIALLAVIFTSIWIVAIINAMNFLDGLNGLPSGVTFIAAGTLFLLSVKPNIHLINQVELSQMLVIMAAMCLAFWRFDFFPAKILMGDSGSMTLGFLLAVLSVFSGAKIATAFLVFGFPLLDMAWVVLRRIFWEKKSPMKGDLKHFHHRLLGIGLSDRQALIGIYSLCGLFGLLAVLLESQAKIYAILAMGILMLILAFALVTKAKKQ